MNDKNLEDLLGKDFDPMEDETVKEYIKFRTDANMTAPDADTTVGSNGYQPGQEFHLTGNVRPVKKQINNKTVAYLVADTKEGTELSLRQLMNISNVTGYACSGEFVNEFDEGNQKKSEKISANVHSDFINEDGTLDFSQVTQPITRKELLFFCACKKGLLANKTARYIGTVVRSFEATRPNSPASPQKYKTGYHRAMSSKLWNIQ